MKGSKKRGKNIQKHNDNNYLQQQQQKYSFVFLNKNLNSLAI